MNDDRAKSRKVGLKAVEKGLEVRGYKVERTSSQSTPAFSVVSPRGTKFWVECRNVNKRDSTWIIDKVDSVNKPYFILTYVPTEQGVDPIEYWLIRFADIQKFVKSYGGAEPQGSHETFKEHYECWNILPR